MHRKPEPRYTVYEKEMMAYLKHSRRQLYALIGLGLIAVIMTVAWALAMVLR